MSSIELALPTDNRPTEIIACRDCGLIHHLPPAAAGQKRSCRRCSATLSRQIAGAVEQTLACYLAALILFMVANAFPFMTFTLEGREQTATILAGAQGLYEAGMWPLAIVVLMAGTLMPLAKIASMLYVLVPLWYGWRPWRLAQAFRLVEKVHPWAMMEVYLLGIIVAYVKLSDLAVIELGIALWAFGGLILVMALGDVRLDPHAVWRHVEPQAGRDVLVDRPGTDLTSCHDCDQLLRVSAGGAGHAHCSRCLAAVHKRKPDSLARTWALLLTAAILYVPANLFPIMTVVYFGQGEPDTILSGVKALIEAGMLPVALLVFFASITVPVLKLVGLTFLLVATQRGSRRRLKDRSRLYRLIEGIGRWSMVDVFMIGILVALVQLGNVASVVPGIGAVAFAAVVIITMLASMSFDPRLMWDVADERNRRGRWRRA